MKTLETKVISKRGIHLYFVCLGGSVGGVIGLITFINDLMKFDFSEPFETASAFLVSLLLLYIPVLVSLKININLRGFSTSNLVKNKTMSWLDVKEIRLFTNYFGRYNAMIIWNNPKSRSNSYVSTLPVSIFSNMKELAQAVTEAAYKANPDLLLNEFTLEMLGGYPPYGIFKTR